MTTGATGQLGLALPVQGELSGTWGNTVNNAITEYTNIAIAATLTLTNDGAVTLANTTGSDTVTNIVSSLTGAGTVTAQFAIVKVTGTLTTTKVVTFGSAGSAPYSKTYTVVNAATGGSVSFTAYGGTGVTIAVGESAYVYYDGTNIVKVSSTVATGVTSFTAGTTGLTPSTSTTGAVTLAGTLGTANGGTGLTSFTSGGVVYASSTSALTTGSALNYASSTLTVNNILAASNGTNIINVDSPSQQIASFVSGVGYGTLNLNATPIIFQIAGTEGMRLTSTGLGIGTSSPGEKLQLGSGSASEYIGMTINGGTASNYGPILFFQKGGTTIGQIANYGRVQGGTSSDFFITSAGSNALIFGINSAETARISTTGGFVVGTTTDPGIGKIADINGNVRTVPQSGSSKTTSYTLATTDVGEYILLGASGAIVIPDATFAAGDVITIFNNTASTATITCSITTAYIAGTFTDKATMTLAAAGVATVLFITSTLCVVSGNVT